MSSISRWDGKSRATKEQAEGEWFLYFREQLLTILMRHAELSGDIDAQQKVIHELARFMAKDVVEVVEQAVKVNAGRGLP